MKAGVILSRFDRQERDSDLFDPRKHFPAAHKKVLANRRKETRLRHGGDCRLMQAGLLGPTQRLPTNAELSLFQFIVLLPRANVSPRLRLFL